MKIVKLKAILLGILVLCAAVLGLFLLQVVSWPWFSSFKYIGCREEYIDLQSTRIRTETYFFFIELGNVTYETKCSNLVEDLLGGQGAPRWKKINSFPLLSSGYSPQCVYGGAPSACDILSGYLHGNNNLSEQNKKELLQEFLIRLRSGEDSDNAKAFVIKTMRELP